MINNRRDNRRKKIRLITATKVKQKRVAIYCRVSTTSASQDESLEVQKSGLEKQVNDNPDWTLFKIYIDKESGKSIYRSGFQEMILDSYENCFDIILVKSISRFNRNTVDLLDTINKLRWLGIEVIFKQENLSSKDRDSDLIMALSASLAQAEGKSLSAAIKWGMKRGFESGESKFYSRKCYGYNKSEIGNLIINNEQATVVKSIFNLYLSGYSVDMIINELENSNIKSPTGKEKWSKRTIQKILTNEKYIGSVILGKTYTDTYPSSKQRVNNGAHDKYLMENNHEPIISIEVFENVQESIRARSNIEIIDGKVRRKNTHYSSKSSNRI